MRATLLAALAASGLCFHAAPLCASRAPRAATPMMPIGMPKVAYRVPGSSVADWVGIYDRLYRERIIFLGQEIDDDLVNKIVAVMLYSDAEDPNKPMYLYINSPGGSIVSGLALYDTMQHIASPIATVNIGLAASMGSFILGAGERGKRIALPHSRVMIHQPMGGARGQAEDIRIEAEQILQIKSSLVGMYSTMTGQTRERILKDLDRDTFMSAEQALEYGLIDKIVSSVNEGMEPRQVYEGGLG
uniref:ATP-dependent Clp protease proteolytic subunit n=1 Tax=Prymnesium polylepis TaxID=72548 RepID=A0A6V4AXL2_9EUKA|mmetsp:Transcript_3686/g.8324  ORF Transcript_3686/g.8324 Transcript_3686/m.8324 type:complete len:245 (+) Transcript_3686:45-779(+)